MPKSLKIQILRKCCRVQELLFYTLTIQNTTLTPKSVRIKFGSLLKINVTLRCSSDISYNLYIALHCIALHYITFITLHYVTLHYTTLHYTTLHYITLHYITLHYITLHYIHTPYHPCMYLHLVDVYGKCR